MYQNFIFSKFHISHYLQLFSIPRDLRLVLRQIFGVNGYVESIFDCIVIAYALIGLVGNSPIVLVVS